MFVGIQTTNRANIYNPTKEGALIPKSGFLISPPILPKYNIYSKCRV